MSSSSPPPAERRPEGRRNTVLPGAMEVAPSERPLTIALVYSRLPLPMDRADQMTVAHLIAFLAGRGHTVDLWTLDNGEAITPEQRAWLERHCRRVTIFRHGRLRRLLGAGRGLLAGVPLQCGWFGNPRQTAAVRAACAAGEYDVAYAYLIRSAEVLRALPGGRDRRLVTFLAMQVSQALNTRRIFQRSTRLRDKLIYGLEYVLTRRYEARVWADFSRVVLIGREDVAAVERLCRKAGRALVDNYVFGPHGVDLRRFVPGAPERVEPATVVFSGVLKTNTNIDAITWFVTRAWPLITAARPAARLLIVGRSPPPAVRRLERSRGVEVVGEVPDVAPFLTRATVCVNPVRACAGQQNKLLEYMAMAKGIVATSFANEGIGAVPGRHFLVADEPQAFADQVVRLLDDPRLRAGLGAAARAFVAADWTWEARFLELEQSLYDALDGRAPLAHPEELPAPSAPAAPEQRPGHPLAAGTICGRRP
jgi:polysaccharide biosynthesis protein PslH